MTSEKKETEELIKETARIIFLEKGFAGTKTRDIAEAAGINLALLNYYFRSKKKLYDLIMMETIKKVFSKLIPILEDTNTTLREKINRFVEQYIDLLSENPNIPIFFINEIKADPVAFQEKLGLIPKIKKAVFIQQYLEGVQKNEIPAINPVHFLVNLSSLVIFPFLGAPLITDVMGMTQDDFKKLLEERKKLIPIWMESMLRV